MKLLTVLFACLPFLLIAQHVNKTPQQVEKIQQIKEQDTLDLICHYTVYQYLAGYESGKTLNYYEMVGHPDVYITMDSLGNYLFYNEQRRKGDYTASYGKMKDLKVEYMHKDSLSVKDIEFTWHFKNNYDDLEGQVPILIREYSSPKDHYTFMDIWIEVDLNEKPKLFRKKKHRKEPYTLYFRGYKSGTADDWVESGRL